MTPTTSPPPVRRSRRRAALAALVAAPLLAVALTSLAPSAEALPRRCDDPGALPCEPPEPPEPPEPTEPAPPPTTDPIPPPPPPTTTWSVVSKVLDQAEGDLGAMTAERMWIPIRVLEPAGAAVSPAGTTRTGPVGGIYTWDPIPAGSAPLVDGRFTFDPVAQPANTGMVLRVTEAGSPGPVCRTRVVGLPPPDGTPLRILAAPPMTVSAAQLDAMVASFVGPVSGLDAGVTATIAAASLAPSDAGLVLSLQGSLTVTVFGVQLAFDFDADQLVTLAPSSSPDLASTLVVSASQLPTVTLDYTGPPVEDEVALETGVAPQVATRIRAAVQRQAPGVVNGNVASLHAVRWWTSQQFSVSIRRVQTSSAGLVVHPAVCRLG
jgi:hypothetical protein